MVNINKKSVSTFLVLSISLCAISADAEVSVERLPPGNGTTLAILERPDSNYGGGEENGFLQEKKKSVVMEAATAVEACEMAYKALNGGDLSTAKGFVEMAKQKLDGLKSAMPDVPVVPIDAQGKLIHLNTDPRRLKALQAKVKELVANNNFQAVRPLIDMMADEMRVRMVFLPINAFKGEIESVSELIGSGYISRAKAHLQDAINALVVKEEMVPIPILRAEELVAEASNLNLSTGKNQAPSAETRQMITDAQEQLKIAEMMGYGENKDYAAMNATTQLLRKEKNTGLFVSESRHFQEEVTDFKNKMAYLATGVSGKDSLPEQNSVPEATKSVSF